MRKTQIVVLSAFCIIPFIINTGCVSVKTETYIKEYPNFKEFKAMAEAEVINDKRYTRRTKNGTGIMKFTAELSSYTTEDTGIDSSGRTTINQTRHVTKGSWTGHPEEAALIWRSTSFQCPLVEFEYKSRRNGYVGYAYRTDRTYIEVEDDAGVDHFFKLFCPTAYKKYRAYLPHVARSEKPKDIKSSLFIEAAGNGDIEAVKKYINEGVDIQAQNRLGEHALSEAKRNNHTEVIKYILGKTTPLQTK